MRRPAPDPDYLSHAHRHNLTRAEARRLWALSTHEAPGGFREDVDMDHWYPDWLASQGRTDEARAMRAVIDSWNDRAEAQRRYVAWMNEQEDA